MFRHLSFDSESEESKKKKPKELKVLFVSRRDSCRGPMAECIFNHLAEKHKLRSFNRFLWQAQSAGLEKWNQGNLPEQLCLRVLAENNLETMSGCRQVSLSPWIPFLHSSPCEAKVAIHCQDLFPYYVTSWNFMTSSMNRSRYEWHRSQKIPRIPLQKRVT